MRGEDYRKYFKGCWSYTQITNFRKFVNNLIRKYEDDFDPFRLNPGRREKIKWNFIFTLHKTFWGTTKNCEKKIF